MPVINRVYGINITTLMQLVMITHTVFGNLDNNFKKLYSSLSMHVGEQAHACPVSECFTGNGCTKLFTGSTLQDFHPKKK